MSRDPQKAKAAKRRHLEKLKVAKYGVGAAGQDMRGRHGRHLRGLDHPRWNNGLAIHQDGYLKVQVGKAHPLADPNGMAYLHLIVWISSGRPSPRTNEVIHHKNEVVTDNRIENLELKTRSAHAQHHDRIRGRNALGQFPPKKS